MCGIAGIIDLNHKPYRDLGRHLQVMNKIQSHRGPDAEGIWLNKNNSVGLAHRRLSIIDIHTGSQPMKDDCGNVVCFNGVITGITHVDAIGIRENVISCHVDIA